MADNKKKSMGNIQKAVLVRTLFPMLLMGVIIALSAMGIFKNSIKKEISASLKSATVMVETMYDEIYPGEYKIVGEKVISLYKGSEELTGRFELIDKIKKEIGYDITLFYGDARFLTTLKDEYGNRYIGTGLNAAAYNEILTNKETVFYEVDVDGKAYFACYNPVINNKEEVVCIVGMAVPQSQISSQAVNAVAPIWIITCMCMILSALISYNYTGSLIAAIKKIDNFLNGMTKGELSNNMPTEILKREDELGHTAKVVTEMQNAIRVLVERDPLTQLYNRRYGGARLRKVQNQSENNGMPFAVVIGDIDHFKRVNDTYGHEAGDVVLKKVSETMKKHMAGKGFVARWGGEEFLLVFTKADGEQATREMEDLLNKVRKIEISYDDLIIKVTMSFGVVDGRISSDYAELLRRADARLYYGKEHGRNRIISNDDDIEQAMAEEAAKKEAEEQKELAENKEAPENAEPVQNVAEAPLQNETKQKEAEQIETKQNPEVTESGRDVASVEKDITAVIDDAFLEQLIERMNEKLYKEALGEDNKKQ